MLNSTTASYAYDAAGRRVQQTVGNSVTNYLWDEASTSGDVVQETDGNGVTQASSVLGDDELLAQTRSGAVSYYLSDGQGNVRLLTDGNGAITDRYTYDAYGNLLSSQGTTVNPYRYTGQQFDSLTGLYDLRARYYDPTSGRFLSRDTEEIDFSNPVEVNRYSYAQENPINLIDPSGHGEEEYTQTLVEDEIATEPLRVPPVLPGEPPAPPHWLEVLLALVTFLAWLWGETQSGASNVSAPIALPAPSPAPIGIPPVATNNDDTRGVAVVFREVAGKGKSEFSNPDLSPGEFKRGKKDLDGLSTFTYLNLPGVKPYAVGFEIIYRPPLVFHEYGSVFLTPGCVGQYTPEHGAGHWSLNCPGGTGPVLSQYARKYCSAVAILDPTWKGPQERKLDCSKIKA